MMTPAMITYMTFAPYSLVAWSQPSQNMAPKTRAWKTQIEIRSVRSGTVT